MVHKVAAHRNIILNLGLDREKLESEAKATCKKLLEDWKKLDSAQIEVSEISGGITNLLWKLLPPSDAGLDPIVLRVFGKQTDKIIDREKEKMVLKHLNAAGFGAQVLATFENGRIEAFLPYRPLKPEEMMTKPMAKRIARRLKQFHAVTIEAPAKPNLFPTIKKWLQQARELDFDSDKSKAEAFAKIDFDAFERELSRVQETAEKLQPQTCYAHNDLLSGNVLVPAEEKDGEEIGEVQFIDFEYTDYSYRSYDIANHFNEYAGLECDYNRFPAHDHIQHFARQYLEEGATSSVAHYSPIDFDYMGYISLRWDEYFRRRDEFLSRAQTAANA